MKFKIEQVALCPQNPEAAIKLLEEMGAGEWARDHVIAEGEVRGAHNTNGADLAFEYEMLGDARELEVLHYTDGRNWMDQYRPRASHIGMHCTEDELELWRAFFAERDIRVAQEVHTLEHSNPVIAGERWYHYVIFDTYHILGIDVKFIVRRNQKAWQRQLLEEDA
jgi:hypothetical protein